MKIRPLKASDLIAQYGHGFPYSVRGFAAEHDGKIFGVAGIMFSRPPQAFSRLDEGIPLRSIVQAMRKMRELLNQQTVAIYATPDEDESTADGFLKHVGFTQISEGVYQWPTH